MAKTQLQKRKAYFVKILPVMLTICARGLKLDIKSVNSLPNACESKTIDSRRKIANSISIIQNILYFLKPS